MKRDDFITCIRHVLIENPITQITTGNNQSFRPADNDHKYQKYIHLVEFNYRSNMEKEQLVPLPLSGTGDLAQNWQEWKDTFFLYLTANNYLKLSEDLKIRKLQEMIGPLGIFFINTLRKDYNENELNNLQKLFAKLDIVCKVPPSEVEARYNFFTCSREKDEFINEYIERLKEKAQACNFGTMMDNLIRDKVITNIKDEVLLLTLFKMKFLDLFDLIKICLKYEMNQEKNREKTKKAEQVEKAKRAEQVEKAKRAEQVEKAKKAEQVERARKAEQVERAKKAEQVEKAKKAEQVERAKKAEQVEKAKRAERVEKANKAERVEKVKKTDGSDINKTASPNDQTQPTKIFNRNCWKCNQRHPMRNCPAFGHKCEKCGDRNHFTSCCNMKIPNVENIKPFYEIPNNTRGAHDFFHNIPQNMNPSAPPALESDNILYPNLNYLRDSRRQMHSTSSKLNQANTKVTETLQTSGTSSQPNFQIHCGKKHYSTATPEKSGCKIS